MSKSTNEEIFDKRLIRSRLRSKALVQKDVDAHLAALPDEADNCEDSKVVFNTPFGNRQEKNESPETD
jgi:hypothetical protein